MPRRQFHQLTIGAAGILQAQHGTAGNGAAERFDRIAGAGGQRHCESFAAVAQRVDRAFHRGGLAGIEPAAESEHLVRHGDADGTGIAVDLRLVGADGPNHHDLRLGAHQRIGAIDLLAQPRILLAQPPFKPRCARPGVHQHHRGNDGEQHYAAHQGNGRDLMLVDARLRGENELANGRRWRLVGHCRKRGHGGCERDCDRRKGAQGRNEIGPFLACAADAACRGSPGSCPACPFAFTGSHRPNASYLSSLPRRREKAAGSEPRESDDFTLNGNRAVRVQIVNVGAAPAPSASRCGVAVGFQRLSLDRQVFETDARQRDAEFLFGIGHGREHDLD